MRPNPFEREGHDDGKQRNDVGPVLTDCGFRQFGFCGLSPGQNVWLARDCDASRSVSPRFIKGQRPLEQVAQLRTNAHRKGRLDAVDGG